MDAIKLIMEKKVFGRAGDRVIIEEFLKGEEASFLAITDGKTVIPLPPCQDHKAVFDGDRGPNTGGMGAYSPTPIITPKLKEDIMDNIMVPTIKAMGKEGRPYKGVLYAGLMITGNGPMVLEFNCRFGDPETQPIMMRLKNDLVDVLLSAVEGKLNKIKLKCDNKFALCVVMAAKGYPGGYEKGKEIYTLTKFYRTAQSTCYNQKPVVLSGDKVNPGDILIDGPASDNGELSLGRNLVIAYASFMGLGYEDAIIISDRLVTEDVLTSIHINEYEAAVMDTKLGEEELTRDIPNVSESDLRNLGDDGIVVIGAEVRPGDILVGKIAPKGETELTAEERLLRAIFGEKAREVRDTSLKMPNGESGTVIDVSILDREEGDELDPGVLKTVKVKVAQLRKVTVGDKLAGRHGNKGVISRIVPSADMPYLEDGTPVDIIISPLSVLARMNLGQLLEAHLGWAASKLGYKVALPVFEHLSEKVIETELAKAGLPINGKTLLYDGRTGLSFDKPTTVGIGYIMKLSHMVEYKTHARSTGPYSLVTQQPLGGKAQMGGQRLGEMEVWALEAHKAAHILQEMLTIKSDDIVGRAKAFEAIVKGVPIPESTVPESFKVLLKELNSLGLDIIPVEPQEVLVVEETVDEAASPVDDSTVVTDDATEIAEDDPDDSEGELEELEGPSEKELEKVEIADTLTEEK